MNPAIAIPALLALVSLALLVWQWLAALKFPLHRRAANTGGRISTPVPTPPPRPGGGSPGVRGVEPDSSSATFAPPISLLKPLKGCDETTADSLRSWFNQNYAGPTQLLFGAADPNDPVCATVQRLIAEHPACDAQLIICGPPEGANAKVAQLARLEEMAKHGFVLTSDADVRVPPDFLANAVQDLRDEKTGLVNCFYRLANPSTPAMQWEAVAVNADFWSQVLQARTLQAPDFALGAAILIRREALAKIGGFKPLAGCLADDFQLGRRIAQSGYRIALCPVVVECWNPPMNWREVWKHQLRWARTIRVCRPVPYFFSILSNATLWPLLWLAAGFLGLVAITRSTTPFDFSGSLAARIALLEGMTVAVMLLLVRIILAQHLQRRFTPERPLVSPFWLVPVKDLLQAAVWFCAFTGNTVEWRGRKMKLRRDGSLVPEP